MILSIAHAKSVLGPVRYWACGKGYTASGAAWGVAGTAADWLCCWLIARVVTFRALHTSLVIRMSGLSTTTATA
jgi:hypothetical protein